MRIMSALAPLALVVLFAGCAPATAPQEPDAAPSTSYATTRSATVPNVVGMAGDDAAASIRAAGFDVQPYWGSKRTVDSELFDVLDQTPAPGTRAELGSVVELSVGAPPLPEHTVERRSDTWYAITVNETITQRDAHWLVREVADAENDEGGYFVSINCAVGGTAAVDNRQANGKFAIGTRGAAITGLSQGQSEAELLAGATCP